jgi:hypothetical protein
VRGEDKTHTHSLHHDKEGVDSSVADDERINSSEAEIN